MIEALIPILQLSDSPKIANVSSSMGKLKVNNIPMTSTIPLYRWFIQYDKSD